MLIDFDLSIPSLMMVNSEETLFTTETYNSEIQSVQQGAITIAHLCPSSYNHDGELADIQFYEHQ